MHGERGANLGFIGGLVGGLIIAVATTGLTASAERNEALRKERRSAYSSLIGSVNSCQGYADLERAEVETALADPSANGSRRYSAVAEIAQLKDCTIPLHTARAEVSIVADSGDLQLQAEKLTNAVMHVALAASIPDQVGGQRYDDEREYRRLAFALDEFEQLARESVNQPFLSPLTISTGGLFAVILLAAALVVVARGRTADSLDESASLTPATTSSVSDEEPTSSSGDAEPV